MRSCPKCSTVVSEESRTCGICGTDLWEAQDQSIQDVVTEAQKAKTAADEHLREKELASARRRMIPRLVFYAGSVLFILYGFLLLFSSTAFLFTIGIVIIVTGFVLLLFFMIGAGPTTRRYRGRWFVTPKLTPRR
jgi:RNA polymerase subunit RPABC4/transcription elongation factor Spt4